MSAATEAQSTKEPESALNPASAVPKEDECLYEAQAEYECPPLFDNEPSSQNVVSADEAEATVFPLALARTKSSSSETWWNQKV
jgi:hypothetical protein